MTTANYDEPTIGFYCEDCAIHFDAVGHLERTDDEGGVEFVPGIGQSEDVYCPNDPMDDLNETRLPHDVSVVT